jgi:hypothetical protein
MRFLSSFLLVVCLSGAVQAQTDSARPFLLGFTPFPYEISFAAVDYTYARIAQDADLIVHHFDNGVPWTEALSGAPYSANLVTDWNGRLARTSPHQRVMVTVTPINLLRDGLALYHGQTDNLPVPAPFDRYGFDHPSVLTAFLNYCDDIIAAFNPDYFLFGIEVNLLMKIAPAQWDAYMTLHRQVYAHLKRQYPQLPAFVSLTGIDIIDGYTDANPQGQARAFNDVIDYTDYLGLSVYPYMTHYMTAAIPTALFGQLDALTDKPLALTETGYPAQTFAIDLDGTPVELVSDPQKQAMWIAHTLEQAAQRDFLMVVNFVLRDYDALWRQIGARNDLTIAWRDTGLYDEDGAERPALDIWRTWLALPHQR